MKMRLCAILMLLLQVCSSALAQQKEPDPFEQHIFPPELVMQNRQAIGLTEEQKSYIKDEILRTTTRFNELQWEIQEGMERMLALVKEGVVDEQQALAQLDKLLGMEREVKRLHITLAIRIKNKLTPEQQARLQEIRKKSDHK